MPVHDMHVSGSVTSMKNHQVATTFVCEKMLQYVWWKDVSRKTKRARIDGFFLENREGEEHSGNFMKFEKEKKVLPLTIGSGLVWTEPNHETVA